MLCVSIGRGDPIFSLFGIFYKLCIFPTMVFDSYTNKLTCYLLLLKLLLLLFLSRVREICKDLALQFYSKDNKNLHRNVVMQSHFQNEKWRKKRESASENQTYRNMNRRSRCFLLIAALLKRQSPNDFMSIRLNSQNNPHPHSTAQRTGCHMFQCMCLPLNVVTQNENKNKQNAK